MLVYLRCHVLSSRLEKLTKRSIARDIQLKLHNFMINSITIGSLDGEPQLSPQNGRLQWKNAWFKKQERTENWVSFMVIVCDDEGYFYSFFCCCGLKWRRTLQRIVCFTLSVFIQVCTFNSAYNFWWIFLFKLIGAIFMFFLFCCCCFFFVLRYFVPFVEYLVYIHRND